MENLYEKQDFSKLKDISQDGNGAEPKKGLSDQEILDRTREWKGNSSKLTEEIKKLGDENYAYYVGRPKSSKIDDPEKSHAYINKIWSSMRAVVSYVTAKPAEPVVHLNDDAESTKEARAKQKKSASHLQKVLLAIYRNIKMQQKNEKVIKHSNIFLIGAYKYGIKDGNIWTDTIVPDRLIIDADATCQDDLEYIGERIIKSAKEWISIFSEKEEAIKTLVNGDLLTRIEGIEWWTKERRVTVLKDELVCEDIENPYYDFSEEVAEEGKAPEASKGQIKNIHSSPKIPYILFNVDNIGLRVLDDTSALEQAKSLQDELNKRKRQISDNAELFGNARLVGVGMTTDQADSIINDDGDGSIITLTSSQDLKYLQPPAIGQQVITDFQDSKGDIDETFATSATFRGVDQEGQETARGREILRSWSEDAQAQLARALERCMADVYTAWLQLIIMFYDTPKIVPIPWVDGAEGLRISRDDIKSLATVLVRPWSTIPDDKLYMSTLAMQLRTGQMLSIADTLEMTGVPNPEEKVKRLAEEQVDMQIIAQKKQQDEEARMAHAQEAQSINAEIDSFWQEENPWQPVQPEWQTWQPQEKNIMPPDGSNTV